MDAGGTAPGARRPPAALFLSGCLAAGLAPHWLPPAQRLWPAIALTVLLGLYALATVFLPLWRSSAVASSDPTPAAFTEWPGVDLVVAGAADAARLSGSRWHVFGDVAREGRVLHVAG